MDKFGSRSPSLARRASVFLLDDRALFAVLAVISLLLAAIGDDSVAAAASRSKFNKIVGIGDAAPEWADLPGVDDKPHSLADYRDAKAVIVVFTCNHCPVAKMYEDRLIDLAKKIEKQV